MLVMSGDCLARLVRLRFGFGIHGGCGCCDGDGVHPKQCPLLPF